MGHFVYATFGVDAVMVLAALVAARYLHPRTETRLLGATAVVVAGSWVAALTVLAAGPLGGLLVAVDLGRWPVSLGIRSPIPDSIEALAVAVLVLTALSASLATRREARTARQRRELKRACADTELMVVESPTPIAFALPGRPARIVVSSTMLRALDAADRRVLLAHERAHLRFHHHLYQATVDFGAAICPVLFPLRARIRFSMERWADEASADELGERRPIARALARAGFATAARPVPSLAFGATGVAARIEALLASPPTSSRWPILWPAALGAGAIFLVAEAVHHLEHLFELAIRLGH